MTEESYRGGKIVVPEQARDKLSRLQFEITAVGPWEDCQDDDCERPHVEDNEHRLHANDLEVGDWVIVRNRSWAESPESGLLIIRQGDILGRFEVR